MIETLIGTLFGGAFRLAPELLKWFDRANERAHELAMFDKQLAADQLRAQSQIAQTKAAGEVTLGVAEVQALIEATKAQGARTGVRWVDALNSLVRPLLALQWLIFLWPAVTVAGFALAVQGGADALVALKSAFGPDEKAMASSIASFWLVDRTLRKMAGQ